MSESTYLRRNQATEYLRERVGYFGDDMLAYLACKGGGPMFRKFGRYPMYTREDLDAWLEERMSRPVRSTSELTTLQHANT